MKKLAKKLYAITMILVMLVSYVVPLKNVFAEPHGEGDYYIKMGINAVDEYTVSGATINGEDWVVDDEYHSTTDEYHIVVTVVENETTGDVDPNLFYGGNWNDYIVSSVQHDQDGITHTFVFDVTNTEHQTFIGLTLEKMPEQQNPPQEP